MSHLSLSHVKIVGMSACVPSQVEENLTIPLFSSTCEAQKVIQSTGIHRRHIVQPGTTASDLSVPAVQQLLRDLDWTAAEVDCLIYVCTSRDFIAPQTACLLQDRLGLRKDCFVMDMPMGCSGWVYGMSVIGSLLSHGSFKKGLLIAAETNTTNRSPKDRTVRPLFGDAATVTALTYDATETAPLRFVYGVDGSGYQAIWAQYGGARFPTTPAALEEVAYAPGVVRKGVDMALKGLDIFAFAIRQPEASIRELLATFDISLDKIDYLLLHQANQFIDEKIRKSLGVPPEKVPYSLDEFGNVSTASIPLTLVSRLQQSLQTRKNYCIASGFGVGLSWASMDFTVDKIICSDLIVFS